MRMREKNLRWIITFNSTADAMATEKRCKATGVPGRLIPVPTSITAGCGMAWSLPLEEQTRFKQATDGITLDGWYKMLI